MNIYKVNWRLYLALLIVSLCIALGALAIPMDNPWFTIITSIGCGGVASVLVAWLTDINNCKERSKDDLRAINQLFKFFDITLKVEIDTCLKYIAENTEFDKNKGYSLKEISVLIDTSSHYDFKPIYNAISTEVKNMDSNIFHSLGQTEFNNGIASSCFAAKKLVEVLDRILVEKLIPNEEETQKLAFKALIESVDKIYIARGIKKRFYINP